MVQETVCDTFEILVAADFRKSRSSQLQWLFDRGHVAVAVQDVFGSVGCDSPET
jgi:hypothetical protein